MRGYATIMKCTVITAAVCVLACGCTDKKRIAELEQTNQALEQRVAKLDNDVTLASNAIRAKQAEAANLQAQLTDAQTKLAEIEKKTTEKKTASTAVNAKKSGSKTSAAKKAVSKKKK